MSAHTCRWHGSQYHIQSARHPNTYTSILRAAASSYTKPCSLQPEAAWGRCKHGLPRLVHARSRRVTTFAVAGHIASISGPLHSAVDTLSGALPLTGPWGVWMALVAAGAFGLWSEKNTKLGRELSGALVATLAGMALANLGFLPEHPKEIDVVMQFLLPLAIPMLLFTADLKRIIWQTGRLLLAFLFGSVMTVAGTVVAMHLFPLAPRLGDAGWRIASALTARHIGGAVNYMAVSETLQIPASMFGAGLAADDLILTFYFTALYTLARNIPPEAQPATISETATESGTTGSSKAETPAVAPSAGHGGQPKSIQVLEGMMAVTVSAIICFCATGCAKYFGIPGQKLTLITGLTVAAATLAPKALAPLVPSAEGLAQILMQIFYASIGASANVGLVVKTAPVLFLFSFIALAVHLGLMLWVGQALGFTRKELLIASNANIGGPSTVAGMTASKGWTSAIVPGILTSTLGYSIGSFIGIGLGHYWLKHV